jgi:transcription antitermination factor NusB
MTKPKNSPRHKARELVLKALYAKDCGTNEPTKSFEQIAKEAALPEKQARFSAELFELCQKHSEWADEQISRLAKNWRIERINYIDRNILRLAMVELQHLPDAPFKVVINEAIELAKTFSTHESASFVNGILDSFAKSLSEKTVSPKS